MYGGRSVSRSWISHALYNTHTHTCTHADTHMLSSSAPATEPTPAAEEPIFASNAAEPATAGDDLADMVRMLEVKSRPMSISGLAEIPDFE